MTYPVTALVTRGHGFGKREGVKRLP